MLRALIARIVLTPMGDKLDIKLYGDLAEIVAFSENANKNGTVLGEAAPLGSAVAAVQDLLGESVRVVSAFQNVAASHLRDLEHKIGCDVLVCGNDSAAREIVIGLARDIGLRAYHAGVIANSAVAEAVTSALIAINSRYKIPGAGIRITGIPEGKS